MESVIFLHGLWMVGADMALIRKRIYQCGFQVHQFHYSTVRKSPVESAEALHRYVQKVKATRIHFVAHSLGGLVLRHFFNLYPNQVKGNVVTLGTPHHGSQIARELVHSRFGRLILGKSVQQGLLGGAPQWCAENKLGVIAGKGRLGVGRFFKNFKKDNDGTVAVEETKIKGMTEHLTVDCSHVALLYNRAVVEQVCEFLHYGHFKKN